MYGWHIAKRIDRKPIPAFADARTDLQNKITRDDRAFLNRKNFVARLKKAYNFVEYPKTKTQFFSTVDTNLLSGTWEIGKMNKSAIPLFTIDGQNYLVTDFANYVEANQTPGQKDVQITLAKMYDQFVEEKVIAYENGKLEAKHPAFRNLMKEYREGILLFELTDKTVWSKAVTDTDGLEAFYQKNKMKYMWGDRINATFYHNNNEAIAKQAYKLAKQKKNTSESILETVNKDNPLNLRITSGKFDKAATTEPVNDFEWKKGLSPIKKINNEYVFVKIDEVLSPQPKELNEIKGLVTSDYQEYLEGVWLEELNKKYKVEVNTAALDQIK
jgi:peptidyl-prolyl cis-trans isomerase SurA